MTDFPRNPLEDALQRAALDPAEREAFLTQLLDARIYVIGHANTADPDEGSITVKEGDTLSLAHWDDENGEAYLPFFSSLGALQQSLDGEVQYLSFKARELFDSTRGSRLILNPGQPYGKEFLAEEVDDLLVFGTSAPTHARVYEADTPIQLGQPKDYPVKLVEGLTRLFARYGAIRRAYLALMQDSSATDPFSLLVGLELDKDLDLASIGIGHVSAEYAPPGMPVDVMVMENPEDGVTRYFLDETQPFYEKSWGQRLRAFFVQP